MRYYGNKTKLLGFIEKAVNKTGINGQSKFVDLFAGTCAVGKHFKRLGYTVISNDNLEFSYSLSKTYIELNRLPRFNALKKHLGLERNSRTLFDYLNDLESLEHGFIYQNYAPAGGRRYFTDANALKIDTFRKLFDDWKRERMISELEFYYLVTALLRAVNLVSNVSGTYAAYLKTWDARALKPLVLEPFDIIPSANRNLAYKRDANELVQELAPDILYLDPPYNSRQYASNYFMLELIAEGWFDHEPRIYGETGMRGYEHQKSNYASKTTAADALEDLIMKSANARTILLSYNNEGLISTSTIRKILGKIGSCKVLKIEHKRYRSINQTMKDPQLVLEHLFVVSPEKETAKAPTINKVNSLSGKEWLQNSFSIWRDLGKNEEERKLGHPAIFTVKLASKLIDTFCPPEKALILDPFAGSGTTLLAGLMKGHEVLGCDLNKNFKKLFLERATNKYNVNSERLEDCYIIQDSRFLTQKVQLESVDLCITSPPYWDILNQRRTADYKESVGYSDSDKDLGNLDHYPDFLDALELVCQEINSVLKPKSYFLLNVMDLRKKDRFFPLHIDATRITQASGFSLEDIIIWDRQSEYNNMRPLGYPFKFIVNKVHEYILIFRKH